MPLRRTGRCLPYGQGITYWPFAEVLKEHLGIRESDSPEEVRRRLGDREILGLTLGLDVAGDLHPLAARDRLHAAWIELASELASERPLVILIEDVHWAEQPLLDLIERLGRDVRGPLLLLATARPDFMNNRSPWSGRIDMEIDLARSAARGDGRFADRLARRRRASATHPRSRRRTGGRQSVLRRGNPRQPHRHAACSSAATAAGMQTRCPPASTFPIRCRRCWRRASTCSTSLRRQRCRRLRSSDASSGQAPCTSSSRDSPRTSTRSRLATSSAGVRARRSKVRSSTSSSTHSRERSPTAA